MKDDKIVAVIELKNWNVSGFVEGGAPLHEEGLEPLCPGPPQGRHLGPRQEAARSAGGHDPAQAGE